MELVDTKSKSKHKFHALFTHDAQAPLLGVHIGKCSTCPVNKACPEVNDTSTSCAFASKAYNEFMLHVENCGTNVQEGDMYLVKSVASIYSTIQVTQLYFQKFGSVILRDGKLGYTDLFKSWVRLNADFRDSLYTLGITPLSRKVLEQNRDKEMPSVLRNYIEAKYTVLEVENGAEEQSQHNRLLQRSEPAELTVTSDTGSFAETDIRAIDEQRADRPVEMDGRKDNCDVSRPERVSDRERISRIRARTGRAEWEDDDSFGNSVL